MAARKPIKKAVAKKATATRVRKKNDDEAFTPLEQYCIALNEYFKALKRAGFPESICMTMVMDKSTYPDWILPPKPLEKISGNDYEEDEDDD